MSQVHLDSVSLNEILPRTEFVFLATPGDPAFESQALQVRREADRLVVLLPSGKQVTSLDREKWVIWDSIRYQPSRARSYYHVTEVLRGPESLSGKRICVLHANWDTDVKLTVEYEYNGLGRSPVYQAYDSKSQQEIGRSDERIMFLIRDLIDDQCFRETVSGASEAQSQLKRIRKLLKG